MKTSLFVIILLLFVHVASVHGKKTEPGAGDRAATLASVFWPKDSTVNVYFVRDLFTSEQKQMLLRTLEIWTQTEEATSTIRFLYAGETSGLIDCLGCLTLTRQEVYTNDAKRQASFNPLRGDQAGQLISAWIGFDSAITESQKLRTLLVQMLGAAHRRVAIRQSVGAARANMIWFPSKERELNRSRSRSIEDIQLHINQFEEWAAS